jgi:hypothetical protein
MLFITEPMSGDHSSEGRVSNRRLSSGHESRDADPASLEMLPNPDLDQHGDGKIKHQHHVELRQIDLDSLESDPSNQYALFCSLSPDSS